MFGWGVRFGRVGSPVFAVVSVVVMGAGLVGVSRVPVTSAVSTYLTTVLGSSRVGDGGVAEGSVVSGAISKVVGEAVVGGGFGDGGLIRDGRGRALVVLDGGQLAVVSGPGELTEICPGASVLLFPRFGGEEGWLYDQDVDQAVHLDRGEYEEVLGGGECPSPEKNLRVGFDADPSGGGVAKAVNPVGLVGEGAVALSGVQDGDHWLPRLVQGAELGEVLDSVAVPGGAPSEGTFGQERLFTGESRMGVGLPSGKVMVFSSVSVEPEVVDLGLDDPVWPSGQVPSDVVPVADRSGRVGLLDLRRPHDFELEDLPEGVSPGGVALNDQGDTVVADDDLGRVLVLDRSLEEKSRESLKDCGDRVEVFYDNGAVWVNQVDCDEAFAVVDSDIRRIEKYEEGVVVGNAKPRVTATTVPKKVVPPEDDPDPKDDDSGGGEVAGGDDGGGPGTSGVVPVPPGSTVPPATAAPATSPPATAPPATAPPATAPPATSPPATGTPATAPPATGTPGTSDVNGPDPSQPSTSSTNPPPTNPGGRTTSSTTSTTTAPDPCAVPPGQPLLSAEPEVHQNGSLPYESGALAGYSPVLNINFGPSIEGATTGSYKLQLLDSGGAEVVADYPRTVSASQTSVAVSGVPYGSLSVVLTPQAGGQCAGVGGTPSQAAARIPAYVDVTFAHARCDLDARSTWLTGGWEATASNVEIALSTGEFGTLARGRDGPSAIGTEFEFDAVGPCSLSEVPPQSSLALTSEGYDLGRVQTDSSAPFTYGPPEVTCDPQTRRCVADMSIGLDRVYYQVTDGTLSFVECPSDPCGAVPLGQFLPGERLLAAFAIAEGAHWYQLSAPVTVIVP